MEEGEISRLHDLIRKDYLTLIDLIFEMKRVKLVNNLYGSSMIDSIVVIGRRIEY